MPGVILDNSEDGIFWRPGTKGFFHFSLNRPKANLPRPRIVAMNFANLSIFFLLYKKRKISRYKAEPKEVRALTLIRFLWVRRVELDLS